MDAYLEEAVDVAVLLDAVLDDILSRQVSESLDALIYLLQRQVGGEVGGVGGLQDEDAEPEERDDEPHGGGAGGELCRALGR